MNGGQILIKALSTLGAKRIFAVPGESYLAVLDALYDCREIELITARQEGGATIMAEAYGKLTNHPGVAFVTRGPGATNASAGVHIAQQDSTPMILFVGQVATSMMGREAFQEIDYRRFFSPICKLAEQIDDASRISEFVNRAYHTAVNGRPGPVVLALPENILSQPAPIQAFTQFTANRNSIACDDINEFKTLLEAAKKPIILTGRAGWNEQATQSLQRFANNNNIPVAATFRCQDTFDNRHDNYIGDVGIGINSKLKQSIENADLLILLSSRFGEMTSSGYSLLNIPMTKQKLIHIYPGAEELNRTYATDLAINCDVSSFCHSIESLKIDNKPSKGYCSTLRDNYLSWNRPKQEESAIALTQIMCWLSENLPQDTIITNGAGNYSAWIHRFFQYKQFHTQLAPTSGSMGYGLPAAISAKCQHTNRQVICFAGDGCLQMSIQELATIRQFKLNIIIILINNNSWGTIRMHQEKTYPGRTVATDLENPDWQLLAESYGLVAYSISTKHEFIVAFEQANDSDTASLIEIRHPLNHIAPNLKLDKNKLTHQ